MKQIKRSGLFFLILMAVLMILMGCISSSDSKDTGSEVDGLGDITSLEMARLLGNGTNLGNTMEAYGHFSPGVGRAPSVYETLWGAPVTTQEMLYGMKEAGFDSIRIPVAWTNAMKYETGDYTIRQDFMERVEEIVNYALNAEMKVIINDHWDGGWWGMFGSANPETRNAAMEMYISMWTQIGTHFNDYDSRLILEAGNEEIGNRLNDTDIAADSGTLSEEELYETTNRINQAFVDTIRSLDGYNKNRFLLVAGYNTDIERTCDERFQMPKDTIDDKLLISVHYYAPSSYTHTETMNHWGNSRELNAMNSLMSKMTRFTDQGYGVVIGEYAAIPKSDGTLKGNTLEYHEYLLNNCDYYGYAPMLWDRSTDFFKRAELRIADEEMADLYKSRNLEAEAQFSPEEVVANAESFLSFTMRRTINAEEEAGKPDFSNKAIAWIMYTSNDWNITYCVGDTYDPENFSDGIAATDLEITEAGTYTVSLDFTGSPSGFAQGTAFSALGIFNGETLFPGYIIDIEEVLINGEPYELNGKPYTSSDDGKCTRVNLYNGWVSNINLDEIRTIEGDLSDVTATPLDPKDLGRVKTIAITFYYGPAE